MADVCCICGNKIGMFEDAAQFGGNDSELKICAACSDSIDKAKYVSEQASDMAKYQHQQAVDFLRSCFEKETISDGAMDSVSKIIGYTEEDARAVEEEKARLAEYEKRYLTERDSVLLTTGYDFKGYSIGSYLGVFSSDYVIGTGAISETKAAFSDVFGVEAVAFSEKASIAKEAALDALVKKVVFAGGNAVLGIDFDIYTLGASMIGVSATGTAVAITEK